MDRFYSNTANAEYENKALIAVANTYRVTCEVAIVIPNY